VTCRTRYRKLENDGLTPFGFVVTATNRGKPNYGDRSGCVRSFEPGSGLVERDDRRALRKQP